MPPTKKVAAAGKEAAPKVPKFPKTTLEKALQIPQAIKSKHGGNPWEPEEIRKAVQMGQGNPWYYLTAAARDYGLTIGTRGAPEIALADLGRDIAYAPNAEVELSLKRHRAFLRSTSSSAQASPKSCVSWPVV